MDGGWSTPLSSLSDRPAFSSPFEGSDEALLDRGGPSEKGRFFPEHPQSETSVAVATTTTRIREYADNHRPTCDAVG
jgi:hypothetical protein